MGHGDNGSWRERAERGRDRSYRGGSTAYTGKQKTGKQKTESVQLIAGFIAVILFGHYQGSLFSPVIGSL